MTKRTNRIFLCVFLYFLLCSNVLPLLFAVAFPFVPYILQNILVQCMIFIPILVLYPIIEHKSAKDCYSLYPLHWKDAFISMGIAFFSLPFLSFVVVLTSPLQPNIAEEAMSSFRDNSIWLSLFFIAVQPAVFEEFLFRGAALTGYRHLGWQKAILMSAFLFGMLHLNLQQGLYAFLFGAIFAFLVQRTGSILASMLPHFFVNATNCIAMYLMPAHAPTPEQTSFFTQLYDIGIQCLGYLPFLIGLLYLFIRRHPAPAPRMVQPTPEGERVWSLSLVSMVVIFVIFSAMFIIPMLLQKMISV